VSLVLKEGGRFHDVGVEQIFPGAGHRATLVSGCAVPPPAGESKVLLAIEDVTLRQRV
jgi:hypothetical protein